MDTAWCPSADDAAPWLEVEIAATSRPLEGYCGVFDLGILPGHAADAASWRRHGRATSARLAPCGATEGTRWDLTPPASRALATAFREGTGGCLRVLVDGSLPGSEHAPACVSTLVLLAGCL